MGVPNYRGQQKRGTENGYCITERTSIGTGLPEKPKQTSRNAGRPPYSQYTRNKEERAALEKAQNLGEKRQEMNYKTTVGKFPFNNVVII